MFFLFFGVEVKKIGVGSKQIPGKQGILQNSEKKENTNSILKLSSFRLFSRKGWGGGGYTVYQRIS
jgi:hypothetical protein